MSQLDKPEVLVNTPNNLGYYLGRSIQSSVQFTEHEVVKLPQMVSSLSHGETKGF